MIAITQTRHLELLQAERDHARRELRKVFGFTARYCGDPSVKVILPEYLVEPVDIKRSIDIMAGKKLPFETETEVTHTRRTTVVLNEQRLGRLLKEYVLNALEIIPSAAVKVGVNINTAGEAKIVVIEDFQDQPTPQVDPELNAESAAAGEHEVHKRLKYKKPETRHFGYQEPEAWG